LKSVVPINSYYLNYVAMMGHRLESLLKAFQEMDISNSGYLTVEELREALNVTPFSAHTSQTPANAYHLWLSKGFRHIKASDQVSERADFEACTG
jgi:Ca2+-binding EF-hand superfamily protein